MFYWFVTNLIIIYLYHCQDHNEEQTFLVDLKFFELCLRKYLMLVYKCYVLYFHRHLHNNAVINIHGL